MSDNSFMYIGKNGTLEYNVLTNENIALPNPADIRRLFGCTLFKEADGNENVVIYESF